MAGGTLTDMVKGEFSPLNIVVLRRKPDAPAARAGFGFDDHEFDQRKPDKGLITKKEVRVLSLGELKLKPESIVWDIGAGSGRLPWNARDSRPTVKCMRWKKTKAISLTSRTTAANSGRI